MTAYKRRLQICFRGGSAAGEQQAPGSSSISTMANAEEREEKEKKKGSACFEREREGGGGETKQTKAGCSCQSHVVLPVFLSPVDKQESTLMNENKTETPLPPFRFYQPRQAIIPCELSRHDHCVHDCLPRRPAGPERQLANSISDVETGLELFHSESTIDLRRTGKIR